LATDLTELSLATQEQVLAALQTVQDTVLDGVRTFSTTMSKAIPANLPAMTLPGADALPDPKSTIDLTFGFTEKLLASQRRFIEQLVAAAPVPATATRSAATTTKK
jgi:hypothetical protein